MSAETRLSVNRPLPTAVVLLPPVGGFRVQKNGGRSVFSVSLEETIAPGMDSKQPQVTSGEPAVNISGKLSLRQQVFTLYIIYIYIYYIYIYIFTHASTYTTCTLPRQSTVPREQAGPIIRGMVRRSFTAAAQICCLLFGLSQEFALSHEAVTLRTCYKKVLSTRLDTRAVFFFSFSLFQQAERE